MTRRILVTGARGFLAGALRAELKKRLQRSKVFLTGRRPARGLIVCDLLDPCAARRLIARTRPSLVFHLAGTTRALDWEGLWRAHVTATRNLLEALRARGPSGARVVLAASSAEYGAPRSGRRMDEGAALEPVTLYGSTKLAQSLTALSYSHAGLEVSAARIFNVMGPGMPENLALGTFARQIALIERGLQRPRLLVGNIRNRRDYLDVRDAARGLIALASAPPGVYNVCSGRSRSLAELLKAMLKLSPCRIEVRHDSKRMRKREVKDITGSHARLTRATGWKPQVPLGQSLKDTLQWHRKRA